MTSSCASSTRISGEAFVATIARRWRCAALCQSLLITLGLALAPASSVAQQIPPPESGTSTVHVKLVNAKQIEIRDATTNAPIVLAKGLGLVEYLDPAVRLTIQLQPQPTGADVVMNFHNTSDVPKGLGMINMGILTLGSTVTYQDIRQTCEPVVANMATYVGKSWPYPADMYCPAWVVSNGAYHVGVSLQYPVLSYKHDAVIGLSTPKGSLANGEGGAGWAVNFLLSTIGPAAWQQVQYGAEIQPGERRTYVMSVRVQPKAREWVRTLLPYRNYFRSLYGGVMYTRNPKPVVGMGFSDVIYLSNDNPFGFSSAYRPDRNGFTKHVNEIKTNLPGWSSVMVWLPSGVYRNHRENNFPSQFVSTWLNWPVTSTSAFDQTNGLASISRSGKDFGLWWGNSTKVAMDWDPASLVDFDPDNADHVERALHELDIAAKAGATTIGLDTFSHVHTPIWKGYGWLAAMRLRYPHMRFVTEPSMCDVMHTLAPTFISAWNDATQPPDEEGLYLVKHPNYIADFLLPGHEIWAGFRYNGLVEYFGKQPNPARVVADIKRFSDYGYVALIQSTINVSTGVVAAKSWNTTVPSDIRASEAPVAFGPAAAGSSHVALGTGSRVGRGSSGPVGGWRPTKPLSRTLPSSKAPSGNDTADVQPSLGPSVQVRSGRVARGTVVVRPRTSPSVVTSDGLSDPGAVRTAVGHPKPRLRMKAFRVSTPTDALSDSIRKERATATEPAEPAAPESEREELSDWDWFQPFLVEVLTDPG